jgi:hypothetical protein
MKSSFATNFSWQNPTKKCQFPKPNSQTLHAQNAFSNEGFSKDIFVLKMLICAITL